MPLLNRVNDIGSYKSDGALIYPAIVSTQSLLTKGYLRW